MNPLLTSLESQLLRQLVDYLSHDRVKTTLSRANRETPSIVVTAVASDAWHSLTFTGHPHRVELTRAGPATACGDLADWAPTVGGHIVAVANVACDDEPATRGTRVVVDLLTIADPPLRGAWR